MKTLKYLKRNIGAALLLITLLLVNVNTEAATLRVPGQYETIDKAIRKAKTGDTVFVSEGIYKERIYINKTLTFIGDYKKTILEGRGTDGVIIQVLANNVVISGFLIRNSYIGIALTASKRCLVAGNTLRDIKGSAIQIEDGLENTIKGNTIEENHAGILLKRNHYANAYNTISDNIISRNIFGIRFKGSNGNRLYNNRFLKNTNEVDGGLSNEWNNAKREGNYWDKYLGEDTDDDGIGDTKIPYLGLDYHPLVKLVAANKNENEDYKNIQSKIRADYKEKRRVRTIKTVPMTKSTKKKKEKTITVSKTNFTKAVLEQKAGRFGMAKALYKKNLRESPNSASSWNNLGIIYLKEKNYIRAEKAFENAIKLKPGYVDGHYNMACFYAIHNNTDEAMIYLKRAIFANKDARNWATTDEDLKNLHKHPEYKKLMEGG